MKKVFISVAVFITTLTSSFANNPNPPKWDGTLLVNKDDGKYTIFVDRTLDLELMEIVAKVNGELYNHDVEKSGRIFVIEDDGNMGWIQVKQEDQSVSSVSLASFMNSPLDYIYGRLAAMDMKEEDGMYAKTSSKSAEATQLEKQLNYPSDNLSVSEKVSTSSSAAMMESSNMMKESLENAGVHPSSGSSLEIQEGQYSDNINLEKNDSNLLDTPTIDSEIDQPEFKKMRAFSTDIQTGYNQFMTDYDPLNYNLKKGDEVPEDVKLTAAFMDENYTIVEDYGEWLIVESKKNNKKYAFNGYHIFKFDKEAFDITYNHEEEIENFMVENSISFRPIDRRNLGVFVANQQVAKLKHKTPYKVSIVNNTMSIQGKKLNELSFVQDGKHCVVKSGKDKETKVLLDSPNSNTLAEKKSYYRHYFGAK
ncbi:hypothetical protein [Sediminitomix flava]|uniref:SH3 domain-containing protein n=1 Tax=Sediminitomix flava TaxID=379075 RepID=A0A315Z9S7_SEDFL|nr:hypothetical protein [Sediminitomix flava]PWJ42032.1 hypothetical protein BC781_103282 [Sediminitomix flava]